MPFQMTPNVNVLVTLTLTSMLKIAFSDFVVTGGILFHKHRYMQYIWG